MVDPSDGMKSFQQALRQGRIDIEVAKTDPDLFVHFDAPNGPPEIRFTYVRLKRLTVTALVMFAAQPPIKGKPNFAIGYAVPNIYRCQGRAKEIVAAAIADMKAGLKRNGHSSFYIEAIVDEENMASRRIAEQLISNVSEAIVEENSGLPAFRYVREVT